MRMYWVAGLGLVAVVAMHLIDRTPRASASRKPADVRQAALSSAQSAPLLQQAENATRPYEQMLGQVAGVDFCRLRSKDWVRTMQAGLRQAEERAENGYRLQAGQQDDEQEFKSHIYYTALGSIMFNGMSVYDPRCQALAASPVMQQLDGFQRRLPPG